MTKYKIKYNDQDMGEFNGDIKKFKGLYHINDTQYELVDNNIIVKENKENFNIFYLENKNDSTEYFNTQYVVLVRNDWTVGEIREAMKYIYFTDKDFIYNIYSKKEDDEPMGQDNLIMVALETQTLYFDMEKNPELEYKLFCKTKTGKITSCYHFKENINTFKYLENNNFDNLIGEKKLISNINNVKDTSIFMEDLQNLLLINFDMIIISEHDIIEKNTDAIDFLLQKYINMNIDKYFYILNKVCNKDHFFPIAINFKTKKILALDAFRPEEEIPKDTGVISLGYYYHDIIMANNYFILNDYEQTFYKLYKYKNNIYEKGNGVEEFIFDYFCLMHKIEKKTSNNGTYYEPENNNIAVNGNEFTIKDTSENKIIFSPDTLDENMLNDIYSSDEYIKYKDVFEECEKRNKKGYIYRITNEWLVELIIKKLNIDEKDLLVFESKTKIQTNSQTCGIIAYYIIKELSNDKYKYKNKITILNLITEIEKNENLIRENNSEKVKNFLFKLFSSNNINLNKIIFSDKKNDGNMHL